MRNKKLIIPILIIIGIFLVTSISSFAATKKIRRLGRYTLCQCKGGVPTAEVMKSIIQRYAGDIKYGFDMAGYGDVYLAFMEQIKTVAITEKSLPVGEKFMWMLYRVRGKVKVTEDLEWAGKAPLEVFAITVKKGYKHYEFVMPKPCGNIALTGVKVIIPDAVCDIKVSPAKVNVNDPVSVDMTGSQHAKSLEVEVLDANGAKVAGKTLAPEKAKWQTALNAPGEYTFKGKAINPEGKPSKNACEAKVYVNYPPKCALSVSTEKEYVGRPVILDASGSSDSDGDVVSAVFEITDEAGNVVDRKEFAQKPFTWEKVFEGPGVYTVSVIVTDDFGGVSSPCSASVEVTEKRFFIILEGGPLFARGSHCVYGAARVGFSYFIVPRTLDFTVSGGGAVPTKGEPWKTFFMASALLNVHTGPVFLGGGIGVDSKVKESRETDTVFIGNLGFDVFDKFTSKGSLFGEVKIPFGSGRSFSKHHKYMLGFRFYF